MTRHGLHVDGLMQAGPEPRGEALDDLLRHAAAHMGDRAVRDEWDSVLSLARSDEDHEALARYRRVRMRAPGFRGRDWLANNHARVKPDWLSPNKASTALALSCATCAGSFHAKRRTARFCSSDCRVKAHRSADNVTLRGPE